MKNFICIIFCLFETINYCACEKCCNNDFNFNKIQNNKVIQEYRSKHDRGGDSLELLGKGANGAIYKINDQYCLKVIKCKKYIEEQNRIKQQIKKINDDTKVSENVQDIPISDVHQKGDKNDEELDILEFTNEISISVYLKKIFNKIDKKKDVVKNIYKIHEVFNDEDNYYIISDLLEGDTLKKKINSNGYILDNKLNKNLVLNDFKIICQAVQFLHDNFIAHMDLKSDNIMFKTKDNKIPYIIDLGTAMMFQNKNKIDKNKYDYKIKDIKGSKRNYSYNISKAINKNLEYDPKQYDVWCLGLILYNIVFRKELFSQFGFSNIINALFSFNKKKLYIKNVLKDRENFDIKKDPNVSHLAELDSNCIFYDLLTRILTKKDEDRILLQDIIKLIEEYQKKLI